MSGIKEHAHLLGVLSDYRVAQLAGLKPATVTYHRKKLGIAAAHAVAPDWSAEEDAKLGAMPDGELAQQIGRTAEAVYLRRMRLKIPAYGSIIQGGDIAAVHLRVPRELKARWVQESRDAGMRLTDWLVQRIERQS